MLCRRCFFYSKQTFDTKKFSSLNYVSDLLSLSEQDSQLTTSSLKNVYQKELFKLCDHSHKMQTGSSFLRGCMQVPFQQVQGGTELEPKDTIFTAGPYEVDTSPLSPPTSATAILDQKVSFYAPYPPVAYKETNYTAAYPPLNYFHKEYSKDRSDKVFLILPLYVGTKANIIGNLFFQYYSDSGNKNNKITLVFNNDCSSLTINQYCFETVAENFEVLTAKADPNEGHYAGIIFTFNPLLDKLKVSNPTDPSKKISGNPLYSLTRLGRLELLGIPQIFIPEIYQTQDNTKLIEDPFDTAVSSHTYNGTNIFFTGDLPKKNTIFSDSVFKCCRKLGKESTDKRECCSGYTVLKNQKHICSLPPRTNLHVYFNRYVSNEGEELKTEDFIDLTGEPKYIDSVYTKLKVLGAQYCSTNRVRFGGAFGYFIPWPSLLNPLETNNYNKRLLGIVDSHLDEDPLNRAGHSHFIQGFRWNHHLYCDD